MQRRCSAADGRGFGEVFVSRVQVVLGRDRLRIAEPLADDVFGELIGQFRLAGGSQVVERLVPRCESCTSHDAVELSPHVLSRVPIPGDDELGPFGSFVECGFQVWPQFGEQGQHSFPLPFVMFGLGRGDSDAVVQPIHVAPLQRQVFTGTSQSTEAGQGEDQPPLNIGAGFQDFRRVGSTDEVEPLGVPSDRNLDVAGEERILADQFAFDRIVEELPSEPHHPAGRVLGERSLRLRSHPAGEVFGVSGGEFVESLGLEVFRQQVEAAAVHDQRGGLGVDPFRDVVGDVTRQRLSDDRLLRCRSLNQPELGELVGQLGVEATDPFGGFLSDSPPRHLARQDRFEMRANRFGVPLRTLA